LHPNTVLFTFNSDVFQDRTEAYAVIEKEIGFAKGFRPINLYGNQKRHELIIEAKFRMESDAHKAIKLGFTHKGIQYRGSPSNDGAENKLVRVPLSHLRLSSMSTSKPAQAQSKKTLGEPDNPEQRQLPTPSNSPVKTPVTATYASSVTKNLFKSPVNPLKTAITNTGSLFRSINPGAVVFDLSHIPTTQETMEDALLAIFDKFTPAAIRGHRQIGPKGNAIGILFDPNVARAHRKTATEQGITVNNTELKANTTQSLKTKFTFVKLRNMPLFRTEEVIVRVLSQSMAAFITTSCTSTLQVRKINKWAQGHGG
jgi:hypothetical protein